MRSGFSTIRYPEVTDVVEIERLIEVRGIYTWASLARRSGVNTATIYAIRDRRSSPRLSTLSAIAQALGVKVRDIITEESGP